MIYPSHRTQLLLTTAFGSIQVPVTVNLIGFLGLMLLAGTDDFLGMITFPIGASIAHHNSQYARINLIASQQSAA